MSDTTPLLANDNSEEEDEYPSVPWKTRFIYALGEAGSATSTTIRGFYLQSFLLEVAQLDPQYTAIVLLIGKVIDAIVAPIIGKLSDNLNTRWGRRRPWMVIAAPFYTLAFALLWQTFVSSENQSLLFAYYVGAICLLNIIENCITVPFTAITTDICDTYDQATQLTEMRMMLGLIVQVIGAAVFSQVINAFSTYTLGYSISAICVGVLCGVMPLISGLFLKERLRTKRQIKNDTKVGLIANLKDLFSTFKSKHFVCLVLVYFLSWTAVSFVVSNILLYIKYVIKRESEYSYFIMELQILAAISSFFWGRISLKAGKKNSLLIGCIQWVLIGAAIYVVDSTTYVWILYLVAGFAGTGVGAIYVLPWSMLPDVIDEDDFINGYRREGAFYSIFVLVLRLGLAIALAVSSWILGIMGYISPDDDPNTSDNQPPAVIESLRIMASIVPAGLIVLASIPLLFYSLNKSEVIEIKDQLLARRIGEEPDSDSNEDPLLNLKQ